MSFSFEGELNPQQLRVATDTDTAMLVLAGAGSGKTKSIIYRCAYLLKVKNIAPWNLMVVTFTNKAARELQERLEGLLNFPVRTLWVGTFHSVCSRILRIEHAHLPFNSNFSIYDTDDQKSLVKKIYKEHGYDPKKLPINYVLGKIGKYKTRLLFPEDVIHGQANLPKEQWSSSVADADQHTDQIIRIYTLYQQSLLVNQALDFDDILLWTAHLLRTNEAVRQKYQHQFQYVMIDEYQDTNHAQFEIVHQIAREHQRVCVVGDDDQAIYSFRGATIRNILEFERDYANVCSIRLEQNYRSTSRILQLANAIIKNNRRRHTKDLWSDLGEGEAPILNIYTDENDEASRVSRRILELQRKGLSLNQMAVLYRTNAQSRVFEYAFIQHKIPHSIVGSLHFYQRTEIRDLLAYLAAISNPSDTQSLLRIINEPPRGIGQTTISRLIAYANKNRISLDRSIQNVHSNAELNQSAKTKVSDFHEKLLAWREASKSESVLELVKSIMEDLNLVEQYRKGKDPKEIARAENLIEFVSSVSEFTERYLVDHTRAPLLADFLPYVALQTDMDLVAEGAESVRLMTMHNAKGLEFECVFIVGLEDGLLPHKMCMGNRTEIEEERRLLYVGVTRAKRVLQLSYARTRRLYDTFNHNQPSMFLQEIDSSLFDNPQDKAAFAQAPSSKPKRKADFTEKDKSYRVGQQIWHEEYGQGVILSVDGVGSDARLTISFLKGKLAKIIGTFVKTEPFDSM
ncbi:MAG: UvrD-helicase domain-containing protein [Candidatus Cloacimonadaceae bacterium]|nr:UvrD-helicase domain-containing protein [Candidatus Cloacimonadaceae bacterium]